VFTDAALAAVALTAAAASGAAAPSAGASAAAASVPAVAPAVTVEAPVAWALADEPAMVEELLGREALATKRRSLQQKTGHLEQGE